jgi:hypothetical protein
MGETLRHMQGESTRKGGHGHAHATHGEVELMGPSAPVRAGRPRVRACRSSAPRRGVATTAS